MRSIYFFSLVDKLKQRSNTIIFISHKLKEVNLLCYRLAILRDGHLVSVDDVSEINEETSMKLLLDMLSGKKPNPEMTLPNQLIVRESSCPPPIDQRLQLDL
ncbi:MAG: ABC-type sugar transport system ATPase subunit [Marinomonas primoryensis]|jgi:ABC-type sugar transport system ATPase subunit